MGTTHPLGLRQAPVLHPGQSQSPAATQAQHCRCCWELGPEQRPGHHLPRRRPCWDCCLGPPAGLELELERRTPEHRPALEPALRQDLEPRRSQVHQWVGPGPKPVWQ